MESLKNLPAIGDMSKSEIVDLLLKEEYGYLPKRPQKIEAESIEEAKFTFCAGKAKLFKIILKCTLDNSSFSFPIYYTKLTEVQEKVPCFVMINFRADVPDRYLPSEELVDAGYAVLSFGYKDVTSDDGDFTNGLAGVVYKNGERDDTQCGKIGLWAWAAMRVMDYAVTLPEIDRSKISVAGHSRLGKTALLAGALDERFYCAFSNDSGCSGASLSRGKTEENEDIKSICTNFPYWFCEHYKIYMDNEDSLPFDQHFLLAANVPHRVYAASAAEDLWADPDKEYLSCAAASDYYKKHGMTGFVSDKALPEVGDVFHDGHIGYHLRNGKHYFSREDWNRFIEYLDLSYRRD